MGRIQTDNILSNWHKLIESFETSSREFYAAVEAALAKRRIPGLKTKRFVWKEGGALAPKREYLRLTDGRIAFDLCAAPFGTGCFFSWWLVRRPATWVPLWALLFVGLAWYLHNRFTDLFEYVIWHLHIVPRGVLEVMLWRPEVFPRAMMPQGVIGEALLWSAGFLSVFFFVALAAIARWVRPEEAMLAIPILRVPYARFFAPQTYHRLDTAIMLRTAAHAAVLEVVDGLLAAKGIRALAADDRKPVLTEFTTPAPGRAREAVGVPETEAEVVS